MEQGKSRYRMSASRQEHRLNLLGANPDVSPSSIPFDGSGDSASGGREEPSSKRQLELTVRNRELASANKELEAHNRELLRRLADMKAANRELASRNAELIMNEAKRDKDSAHMCEKLQQWSQWYENWNEWMESAKIGTLFLDMELRIKQFNSLMSSVIELNAEDIDRPFGQLAHTQFEEGLYADILRVATSLKPLERELRSKCGCWYNLIILPYSSRDKQPSGIAVTLAEITDLKQATTELLKLSYAVEQNHSIILITDTEGFIEYSNLKFTEHIGYTPEEVLGQPVAGLHPEEISGTAFGDIWNQVMEGNRWAGEIEMIRKDGERFWEGATILPIKDREGKIIHVLKMSQNITDHKTAEELLRKSEMLSAIGQLAAGIAHEIRNPLTALKGFTKLLERGVTNKNKDYTRIMGKELERIETIINEFLVLAKPQVWSFEKKSIPDILKDVLMLLKPEALLGNVELITDYDSRLKPISCVENQLKQVFLNILKNSLEAVPQGGVIKIEAGLCEDEYLFVRIVDNGCGIPEEKLARLGEPFYSTKEKGTGLGLMVSFKIIENHRGAYTVKSGPGGGTSMEIRLPFER
ncbi:PAS domain-containing sensor histidine kinase [Gorillibacterium timonense]|uniref:PAS domain-containing sensor histidine kinase n=1 Tax=Gorillibacterium timonense TaxID=1689269 RepID=UPI00071D1F5D|nr:PAS domain-containing sensor histidine kinase [Gorillibacterium timonense]